MVPANTFIKAHSQPGQAKINVTDLFAGAGGFSMGFEAAGYHVQSAIEIDAWACETLSENHTGTNVIKATQPSNTVSRLGRVVADRQRVQSKCWGLRERPT